MRKSCIMTGLVSFALALAISLPASAQTSTTTPAQPIIADENKQMDAVRSDTSLTTDQKIQKANQIRSDASPKIRAVLTPEQLQKLAQLQEKAKQQRENQGTPASDSQKPQK